MASQKTTFSHVVGFDDAPFARTHRGDVLVVGTVFTGPRLDGVLSTRVRRDGSNSTDRLAQSLMTSKFFPQLQAIFLQGIALAGFNVVDIERLRAVTGLPVLVAARRLPDMEAIRAALLDKVPGGTRKWRLIQAAGPMQAVAGIYIQSAGLAPDALTHLVTAWQLHGNLPEPLRVAHMIAGGIVSGESRHRA